VPVNDVLACTEHRPLFGQRSGKASKTHWLTFLKPEAAEQAINAISIYTDGACNTKTGMGGWAALIRRDEWETVVTGTSTKASPFQMEAEAVIGALTRLDGKGHMEIYTDCELLVRGMTEYLHVWIQRNWKKSNNKPVKNRDVWERLMAATAECNITWNWIRGHAGHPFNTRVHMLARQACRQKSF